MPSTPRRRSARLAKTPKAATVSVDKELASVAEEEEGGSKTPSCSVAKPKPKKILSTPQSSAIKPPHDEMHPSKARPAAGEPSSGLQLGFSDIAAGSVPTPSKKLTTTTTTMAKGVVPSSPFSFRADKQLSSEARRMMDEIRGQAMKFRADIVAQNEQEVVQPTSIGGRVIAKLKGRGRFSAAHTAEFDKMDSIEGHASAWRAQNNRFTPVKSSLKHSASKTMLDGSVNSTLRSSPSKTRLVDASDPVPKRSLKRTSSVANLDHGSLDAHGKLYTSVNAKRVKQLPQDDISSGRPVSRDASALPRPVSGQSTLPRSRSGGLARLMSPTKASLAHSTDSRKPLTPSPSKTSLYGLSQSASTTRLPTFKGAAGTGRRLLSPGRFQEVKSILRGQALDLSRDVKTAIPQPAAQTSQTPAPVARTDKPLPPVPATTPRRKLTKRVDFTPETKAVLSQRSPSPLKSDRPPLREIEIEHYDDDDDDDDELPDSPGLKNNGERLYPDLSPLRRLIVPGPSNVDERGAFTFRSDRQCKFEDARDTAAKASIRRVRESAVPVMDMPGNFPAPPSPSTHSNKENASPTRLLPGTAHGMQNKKRHRVKSDSDDADEEAAARAMKKRKNAHVPEGQALLAPRLLASKKAKIPGKKSGGAVLSKSRLNMLARPKNRG
ncbi:erythromycin esterase [Ophiocordyceps camponoti-floridani]|uniref:Erythromycin esterase n=1 Tax=Ophiocordyceps camponoti-floridani TaxID=2030778 RepID=A0A8H4Q0L6_9HYPO|nr:erythromycin esterase [Ophiocordyceps camponoti-floridani]